MGKLKSIATTTFLLLLTSAVEAAEPSPVVETPSRLVETEAIPEHVKSIATTFAMSKRETDPFGRLQDPEAKPIIKRPVVDAPQRAAVAQITPFIDIVRLIQVTTIIPKERKFLLGSRVVQKGEEVSFAFRGRLVRVKVNDVTSRQITFQNIETGEVAARKLDLLPPGMSQGTRLLAARGLSKDTSTTPIDLEPSPSQD